MKLRNKVYVSQVVYIAALSGAGILYGIKLGWLAIVICSLSGFIINHKEIETYFRKLWKEHVVIVSVASITVYLVLSNDDLNKMMRSIVGFSCVGLYGAILSELRFRHYIKTMANESVVGARDMCL